MEEIMISIIIPTADRATSLKRLLDTILNQNSHNYTFEIIVVDNGSVDDTCKVCDQYATKFLNFRYIFIMEKGLHHARHCGMLNAKGEILTFLDDDVTLRDNYLSCVNESFDQDESIVLVGGKVLPVWEGVLPFWLWHLWNKVDENGFRTLAHLSLVDLGDSIIFVNPRLIFGCNFSVRKKILIDSQGFHPDGMPENKIMFRGDGETYVSDFICGNSYYNALYHPGASVYHHIPSERMTYDYFAKRSFHVGISRSYSNLRSKSDEKINKNLIKIKYFLKLFFGIEYYRSIKRIERSQLALPIEQIINKYTHAGYEYHQNQYKIDEELRKWVHRENYL